MTVEEFELIKKIIDNDVEQSKTEDLDKMLNYLIDASSKLKKCRIEIKMRKNLNFENEILEKNKQFILKNINELIEFARDDEEKTKIRRFLNVMNRNAFNKIKGKVVFPYKAVKQLNMYIYELDERYFCIGHLIQLTPEDLIELRGLGTVSIKFINNILKENGLSLGMFVTDEDNEIMNEIITENIRLKMLEERKAHYQKTK